jgi:hypothetical protein
VHVMGDGTMVLVGMGHTRAQTSVPVIAKTNKDVENVLYMNARTRTLESANCEVSCRYSLRFS